MVKKKNIDTQNRLHILYEYIYFTMMFSNKINYLFKINARGQTKFGESKNLWLIKYCEKTQDAFTSLERLI